jgi:uncharacterized protein (DUF305 family)
MMGNNTESSFNQGMMNNSQIDAHFIEQMIPHHQDAITMAKLALEKGQHQEIKTLAQNIITSQSSEIEQMKNWYKEWYGRELPSGNQVMNVHGMMSNNSRMHMGKMGNDSDLDQLKNAADFDKKFIEEMIPHHQMAVMMASMLKQGTTRPEMKQLADDIITAQTSEIDQMRQWYQNWSN